jgi:hypothetical protein
VSNFSYLSDIESILLFEKYDKFLVLFSRGEAFGL